MGLLIIVLVFVLIEALLSLVGVCLGWGAYEYLMIHVVLYGVTFVVTGSSMTSV